MPKTKTPKEIVQWYREHRRRVAHAHSFFDEVGMNAIADALREREIDVSDFGDIEVLDEALEVGARLVDRPQAS